MGHPNAVCFARKLAAAEDAGEAIDAGDSHRLGGGYIEHSVEAEFEGSANDGASEEMYMAHSEAIDGDGDERGDDGCRVELEQTRDREGDASGALVERATEQGELQPPGDSSRES